MNIAVSLPESVRDVCDEAELDRAARAKVEQLLAEGEFELKDVAHISNFMLPAASGEIQAPKELLERLRRAAQAWDVELKPKQFTSHRPVIGPMIIAIKKALFPIIKFFMAETITQQRDFNAAVLRCLVELSKDQVAQKSDISK